MSDLWKEVTIWTDGGARGNPGPAGIGAVAAEIKKSDPAHRLVLFELSEYIGTATNNQAEYRALIGALAKLYDWSKLADLALTDISVDLLTDSELMAYQVQGKYKVKNVEIKPLHEQVVGLLAPFASYRITPIRREKNQAADRLVNQAIDAAIVTANS